MIYKANCNSYGFRGRYWAEGDLTPDLPPDEIPPKHFDPVEDDQAAPEEPGDANTFSEITKKNVNQGKTKTGMQYSKEAK